MASPPEGDCKWLENFHEEKRAYSCITYMYYRRAYKYPWLGVQSLYWETKPEGQTHDMEFTLMYYSNEQEYAKIGQVLMLYAQIEDAKRPGYQDSVSCIVALDG